MILVHRDTVNQCPDALRLRYEAAMAKYAPDLPCGRYPLDGDNYFMVSEYDTEPADTRRFEAHARYTDVQILMAGEEAIAYLPKEDCNAVTEDRYASDDIAFLAPSDQAPSLLALHPGAIAVFRPGEAHKPNCALHAPCAVRKLIVKVWEHLVTH